VHLGAEERPELLRSRRPGQWVELETAASLDMSKAQGFQLHPWANEDAHGASPKPAQCWAPLATGFLQGEVIPGGCLQGSEGKTRRMCER
jgi:hypothetical protein